MSTEKWHRVQNGIDERRETAEPSGERRENGKSFEFRVERRKVTQDVFLADGASTAVRWALIPKIIPQHFPAGLKGIRYCTRNSLRDRFVQNRSHQGAHQYQIEMLCWKRDGRSIHALESHL